MRGLPQQFISCLLTLLLAFAPLQPVAAASDMSAPAGNTNCHDLMDDGHNALHSAHDMACEHCETGNLCDDNCCSAGICHSLTLVLMPSGHVVNPHGDVVHDKANLTSALPRFSNAHFRPPRA